MPLMQQDGKPQRQAFCSCLAQQITQQSGIVMNTLNTYVHPAVPVVMVIVYLVAARLMSHRHFVLFRSLAICALCACCFAGPFVRFGWDKALVAFLVIFVIPSLVSVGRWSEHRHYESTRTPKKPTENIEP